MTHHNELIIFYIGTNNIGCIFMKIIFKYILLTSKTIAIKYYLYA